MNDKVYLLLQGERYEGDYVVSVHRTRAGAYNAANEIIEGIASWGQPYELIQDDVDMAVWAAGVDRIKIKAIDITE